MHCFQEELIIFQEKVNIFVKYFYIDKKILFSDRCREKYFVLEKRGIFFVFKMKEKRLWITPEKRL